MDCGVVIVAAGRGERLGHAVNKAMVPLGGCPLVLHALRVFAGVEAVREIVLVIGDDDAAALRADHGGELAGYPLRCVAGGARRQDSVARGLSALTDAHPGAMVHDAARPFVAAALVAELARRLDAHEAVVPGVPATSTVKRVDAQGRVLGTVPRHDLLLAQTPQAAHREALIDALERAALEGWEVTDDVQAMERAGHAVVTTAGSPWNFKITTPADLALAEIVLETRPWETP